VVVALLTRGIIDDPFGYGRPRLDAAPVVLSAASAAALAEAACAVAMMLDEAVPAVASDRDLMTLLGMDPSLQAVAALDAPRWLGLARADVFLVDGAPPQVCELNCDTPTGLAECSELGALAAADHPHLRDPSAQLGRRWTDMVLGARPDVQRPVVGIVDPTEMPEDLCHIRILTAWLESAGCTVVRGSPFNLHACPGRRVGLFGTPCDILVRHYKTDWWARPESPWLDGPVPADRSVLHRELALIGTAMAAGTLAVVNPWGSAIAQNKRCLALPWEHPDLFSADTLALVRRHLPETRFLTSLPTSQLIAERSAWVLKSDYGCEGDEVILGSQTDDATWRASLAMARPGRWIVQRAFTPQADGAGRIANHGIYLIGGRPSGIYTRTSAAATDVTATSRATLVMP
jgi:glutathionylspermidine synthase